MHKYLRSIGFGTYQKKKEIAKLLDSLEEKAKERKRIQVESDSNLCEIRAEVAPGMGIAIVGETDEDGVFRREYYYPYLIASDISSEVECTIQRHTEKETFGGLLDETRVGISLIFYLDNGFEYLERKLDRVSRKVKGVRLTGLSGEGKILLPLHKTRKQIEKAQVAAKDRNSLLEAARNGDEDAMETLTIEDIDMYSMLSRRIMHEDVLSIVDSYFMPFGIESDQYSVLGEILNVCYTKNTATGQRVCIMTVDTNDLIYDICINENDLLGEPVVGRRFKGNIWLQGSVRVKN